MKITFYKTITECDESETRGDRRIKSLNVTSFYYLQSIIDVSLNSPLSSNAKSIDRNTFQSSYSNSTVELLRL